MTLVIENDDFAFTDPDAYDVVINGVFFENVDRLAHAEAIENEAVAIAEIFGLGLEVEFFGVYQDRRGNYFHQFKGNIPLAPALKAKSPRELAQDAAGYELLSVPGKALWDALWADNEKFHDNPFFEAPSFCDECGRNLDWSHAEDCASGAADRILSGEATPFD